MQVQATTSNGTAEAKAKQQTSSGMQMEINGVQQISSNRQKGPRRLQEKRLCPYLRQWISTWVSARRRRWFLPFWFVVQLHAKLVARRSAGKETNNRWRPGADMKGDDLMWFVMVAAASEGLRCGCCGSIRIIWAKQGATHGIYDPTSISRHSHPACVLPHPKRST